MRFRALLAFAWIYDLLVCGVLSADGPVTVQKIYVEKNVKNDLATEASGYIFRSDGDNPPILIKLGANNINQYEDVLKNAGVNLDMDKPRYTSYGTPSKNTYSNVQATTTYSTHEDVFKEAFKNIPSLKDVDDEQHEDFPPLKLAPEHFDDVKSLPGEDDGYENAGIESPNSVPHYESSGEYADSPPPAPYYPAAKSKSPPSKAYVAPVYDAPEPHQLNFNQRQSPVKYSLQPKAIKTHFGHSRESYELPAELPPMFNERSSNADHSEYSSHYSADYHHKPKKHKFEKGGGDAFKSEHHSSHGEKGDKGYKKYHDFDEGEMGHHGKDGKKGYYDNESGHKKSHHNEGKKYGEVHGKHHGGKGAKYDEKEEHNKGHKTSGYHNIFHKDEFKKEHKFYDDAHKHKYHDKHGGYHTDHGKKHGHKASGGFHDSAFDQGHKGNSGHYKKGHFDQDHKGHKGSSGHESHYNHHDDYAKKGGHSEKKKHGYEHSH